MDRQYFGELPQNNISRIITENHNLALHKQHRDWTCSVACLRSILCTEIDEDWFIDKFNMQPGPYYSKDLKVVADTFSRLLDL